MWMPGGPSERCRRHHGDDGTRVRWSLSRPGSCYDVGCRIQEPVTGASLPANFAMPVAVLSTSGDDAGPPEAGLAARVAAGPGLWENEDWLAMMTPPGSQSSSPGSLATMWRQLPMIIGD